MGWKSLLSRWDLSPSPVGAWVCDGIDEAAFLEMLGVLAPVVSELPAHFRAMHFLTGVISLYL